LILFISYFLFLFHFNKNWLDVQDIPEVNQNLEHKEEVEGQINLTKAHRFSFFDFLFFIFIFSCIN